MDQFGTIEWLVLTIEITGKRKIHRGGVGVVQVDFHRALFDTRRPDMPNHAWTFHFGQDQLVTFLAHIIFVRVATPVEIPIGCRVVAAVSFKTGKLSASFPGPGKHSQSLQVRKAIHEIDVG